MPNHDPRRSKPIPSAHQKQIRFFTILALACSFLFLAAIFWLVNRQSFAAH